MEDVLDVYARPGDEARPVVCVDEGGKQLVGDVREPLPVRPGAPAKQDYEYERGGVANLFMAFEPLAGRRHVEATERKTAADFARFLRVVSDELYPGAERVVLVCDNLNTHTRGAFYEAFPPPEARALVRRLEFRHTPKHGSWLNVAENELSALTRQCLRGRRFGTVQELRRETAAWQQRINDKQRGVDWQFRIDDARTKLKSLYPKLPV